MTEEMIGHWAYKCHLSATHLSSCQLNTAWRSAVVTAAVSPPRLDASFERSRVPSQWSRCKRRSTRTRER